MDDEEDAVRFMGSAPSSLECSTCMERHPTLRRCVRCAYKQCDQCQSRTVRCTGCNHVTGGPFDTITTHAQFEFDKVLADLVKQNEEKLRVLRSNKSSASSVASAAAPPPRRQKVQSDDDEESVQDAIRRRQEKAEITLQREMAKRADLREQAEVIKKKQPRPLYM